MKEELIQDFVTAFSRLRQKVVWKSTRDLPEGTDQTKIKTMHWLPQNDLLGEEFKWLPKTMFETNLFLFIKQNFKHRHGCRCIG